MKTLKTMSLSFSAAALLTAGSLYAENKTIADIPFEFSTPSATLPAGEYTLSKTGASQAWMVVRNVQTHKAVMLLAPDSGSKRPQDKNVVVFHRIGDRYFLAEVKTDTVRGQIPPAKVERELTAEGSGARMAAVIVPALSAR